MNSFVSCIKYEIMLSRLFFSSLVRVPSLSDPRLIRYDVALPSGGHSSTFTHLLTYVRRTLPWPPYNPVCTPQWYTRSNFEVVHSGHVRTWVLGVLRTGMLREASKLLKLNHPLHLSERGSMSWDVGMRLPKSRKIFIPRNYKLRTKWSAPGIDFTFTSKIHNECRISKRALYQLS